MQLDQMDRQLLNIVQEGFPLVSTPFVQLAKELATSEADVVQRLQRLQQEGIIRYLGPFFDSKQLGYVSTLCAMVVPDERITAVAAIVNSYSGVTHNYLREHRYNMWFTLIAPSAEQLHQTLEAIRQQAEVEEMLNLPATNLFKIRVNFKLEGNHAD